MAIQKKDFEQYGQVWDAGTTPLAIELWGYRNNVLPAVGGLGAEGHFRNAFHLAWPKFLWHDWMELLTTAFCQERFVTVIGHTRATKTYGAAHLFYLDYCAAPLETWTSLTTVTFDGLKSRMWSDMMAAVETASFPCPFKISSTSSEMKMRMKEKGHRADEKFMVEGFATSKTKDSKGRIQGKHANRRRLGLDEAQELPDAIFEAETNAGSAPDFKSLRLANPTLRHSKFGRECMEPAGGWEVNHDTNLYWRTKAGHLVLHFDGMQCYNVKLYFQMQRGQITPVEYAAKKLPFMLTYEYAEEVRTQKGEDSLEWWMYVRGYPPGDGIVSRCFPELVIDRMKHDILFDFRPTSFAVLDPAYTHDECVIHFGAYSEMREGGIGIQFSETLVAPINITDKLKTKDEQIAEFIERVCKERAVLPENFIQDVTGNGRSVYSHLSKNWGRGVLAVEFGGAPTNRPLIHGQPKLCDELFCYMVDELHFRAAAWATSGRIGGLGKLSAKTTEDLACRLYFIVKGKQRVESKDEVKKRLGRSPDHGDAFILVGELMARKGHLPGLTKDNAPQVNTWAAAREEAKSACQHYSEAHEYENY